MTWELLLPFIVSMAAATASGPIVMMVYRWLGWIDDPNSKKEAKTTHTKPVPRGGGLVVAAGLLAAAPFYQPITPAFWGIAAGALILLISGTLDDRFDINPYLRYLLNLLAAGCVIAGGVGIDFVTNPLGNGVINLNQYIVEFSLFGWLLVFSLVADGFALLWIVWNMNAVNWSKGVDGQLPGFVAIAAFFISLLSLRFQADTTQGMVTVLALAVSGAYAGLLVWNVYPQKMMPGYAGGSLAGYFLAVLAILSGAKIATALLLLAIPTADGLFTVTRRIATGRSPFWGDRGHLHHRLLDIGWGRRRIAVFYWLTTLLFGLIALQLNSQAKTYALVAVGILFALLIVWLNHRLRFRR